MALWNIIYNMPLIAKINYKITTYMLENDNHQQNMLHVRMESRQQHMLQQRTCNIHTLNIKIFAYIACYWNNVSLK
jgi:hypothetical protein